MESSVIFAMDDGQYTTNIQYLKRPKESLNWIQVVVGDHNTQLEDGEQRIAPRYEHHFFVFTYN